MMTRWRLRPAHPGDLLPIERIEVASFGNPWLADIYAQELERDVGCVEIVESEAGDVIGLFCVWCVADEAHLMRIATAPAFRRAGIGRALLVAAMERARAAGCMRMTLEVAASNDAAIRLYEAAGFTVVGRRHGYYRIPPDDALLMRCELTARAPNPARHVQAGRDLPPERA